MIITVTLNPLLEQRFVFPHVQLNENHRNPQFTYAAGGKGINVCRQLARMNQPSHGVTFTGGNNGKLFLRALEEEDIHVSTVQSKSETRFASIIVDSTAKHSTTFFGNNSSISEKEVHAMKERLSKMIPNCEMIIFSGSSSCEEADSIFPYAIELANNEGRLTVLDTYGRHLEACLKQTPAVVHNNCDEVRSSLGRSLETEDEKRAYLFWLYEIGIKQAFLTDGGNPFYASNFDYHYRVDFPAVPVQDATGSGDSFTASLAYSRFTSMPFEKMLRTATGYGIANAESLEVCTAAPERAEALASSVTLTPIGKKMRILDVTPTIY